MSLEDDCRHGLAPGTCTLCLHPERGRRRRRDTPALGPSARATFAQKCPGCGGDIEEGALIVLIDNEWCCARTCSDYEVLG